MSLQARSLDTNSPLAPWYPTVFDPRNEPSMGVVHYQSTDAPDSLNVIGSSSAKSPFGRLDTDRSISRKIDNAVNDAEMYDEGETHPSEGLVDRVKGLIRNTRGFMVGLQFPLAEVRPLDGSIRLSWITGSKNVRLVCSDRESDYIFYEKQVRGKRPEYGIYFRVEPQLLAERLNWLRRRR